MHAVAEKAKSRNPPDEANATSAAPTPEAPPTPSVSVAQRDADATAAEIHQLAEEEEAQSMIASV